MMLKTLLSGAVLFSVASCALEYHYSCGEAELQRVNYSIPASFQGVPIGVTELDSNATEGTIHSLSEGHHFCQKGWYGTRDSQGTPVWRYSPSLRDGKKRMKLEVVPSGSLEKRGLIDLVLTLAGKQIVNAAINMVCCGRQNQQDFSVASLNSANQFADGGRLDILSERDIDMDLLDQSGGLVASIADESQDFVDVFSEVAFWFFDMFE